MILDRGVVSIFRAEDAGLPGGMPKSEYRLLHQGWYGVTNYETSPQRPTDHRLELRCDKRIRILRCEAIQQHDVAILANVTSMDTLPEGTEIYEITRCYHGVDDGGPTEITDLSLAVMSP